MLLRRDPWRRPRLLALLTWAYLTWWYVPIAILVRASVSANESGSSPSGVSLAPFTRAFRNPGLRHALFQSLWLATATVAVSLPLGVGLAIGLQRARGRGPRAVALLSVMALATPHVMLSVAFFLFFIYLLPAVKLDSGAQLIGHITIAIPLVAVIAFARLASIDPELEEIAMDLGAGPTAAVRRVVFPLMRPAILAGAIVAFTVSFDDLAISNWLCFPTSCRTVPLILFRRGGIGEPAPPVYALGVIATTIPFLIIAAVLLTRAGRRMVVRPPAGRPRPQRA